jgi:hypothetical protein
MFMAADYGVDCHENVSVPALVESCCEHGSTLLGFVGESHAG